MADKLDNPDINTFKCALLDTTDPDLPGTTQALL